tara:strand:- start:33045 stop:33314 length:270 start_codon:yes stop_codon:yes gene_type:complete
LQRAFCCVAAFYIATQHLCRKCNAASAMLQRNTNAASAMPQVQHKMLRMQCCKCNAASAKGPPANAALQQGMPHRRTPPESSLSPFNWL